MPDRREIAAPLATDGFVRRPAGLRCIAQNLALRDLSDHARINMASGV
jgi:hypothetical protein